MEENIKRFNPQVKDGLNIEEVEERKKQKLVNYDTSVSTKSIKKIIATNIFTIFNILNLFLAILIVSSQSYKNLIFLGVVICNTLISIIQELRSKAAVDKLSIISARKVTVVRNSTEEEIGINDIVLDDIIKVKVGNQIVTDSIIQEGEVEVNESFITGESDTVYKKSGDMILSGSFIVSGSACAKVEHVGKSNYTSTISSEAKYVKKVKSEIMTSLNKVIRVVSIIIIPVGILLFKNEISLPGETYSSAIVETVAAIIGMIPEGLVLLTSTVLAVSVVRLTRAKVLVQELFCIESLARVDTLCLDKTGTITEGKMEVSSIVEERVSKEELEEALTKFAYATEDVNATILAIREKYSNGESWEIDSIVAFNSQNKWSGINFKNKGSYILGAPEFVICDKLHLYKEKLDVYSEENRVLVMAHSNNQFIDKKLPSDIEVLGFVLIRDIIRKEANATLKYFKEQGVDIKIISGDNPITVSNIAKRAGVENYDKYIDATTLKTSEDIENAVKEYTIFGRVLPLQKRDIIRELKKQGRTVAMTGDGVNDVLALKEADCSVTVASGSDAARNISQLVLLDSDFKSMPKIVAEGRRTINNIERSAQLFLVKTIYSAILAILFVFIGLNFPFKPIQLSFLSTTTIGIPAFILALQPNKDRVTKGFLRKILSRALPTSITVVLNILAAAGITKMFNLDASTFSTLCFILTSFTGFMLMYRLCYPFNLLRGTLMVSMLLFFVAQITILRDFLYMKILSLEITLILVGLIILSIGVYFLLTKLFGKIFKMKIIEKKLNIASVNVE